MGVINQWEDVTYLECNTSGNTTCFKNGLDIINYYGFSQVCIERKVLLLYVNIYIYLF